MTSQQMPVPEFHLHTKQGIVYQDPNRFKVLVTGRRFGKTILIISALAIEALSQINAYLWFVAPTFKQAKMIAWRMLKNMLYEKGIKAEYNESELSAYFPSTGSILELKGADKEDSLRGIALGCPNNHGRLGLGVDEFASIHDNWSVWHEVLRPLLTDWKAGAMFIGTPKGKDALYELFLKGQRQDKNWASWQFKTLDNPWIDPEEVEEARKNMPERYFRQEYEGSFEDYQGLIYPEFRQEYHVIGNTHVPDYLPLIGGIDPAISGTTAVLMAYVDEKDRLVIYDEYYEQDVRVSEVCKSIRNDKIRWVIDPASAAKNIQKEGRLCSIADEYRENGIITSPAENDVYSGINRVAEAFKSGKLLIMQRCKNLIYEIERYHWAENALTKTGLGSPKPYKHMDHAVDVMRYLVQMKQAGAELIKEESAGFYSPIAIMKREKQRQSVGGYSRGR